MVHMIWGLCWDAVWGLGVGVWGLRNLIYGNPAKYVERFLDAHWVGHGSDQENSFCTTETGSEASLEPGIHGLGLRFMVKVQG